jgi:hypothetical protein
MCEHLVVRFNVRGTVGRIKQVKTYDIVAKLNKMRAVGHTG